VKAVELLEGPAPKPLDPAVTGPVAAAAAAAVGDETDPEERIELLLDWLDESIERGFEAGDASAEAALQKRRGDATEFTRLFCKMVESVGLPARARVGLVAQRTSFHFHCWAEVWLDGWVPVDPYLGQFPADLTHIRLVTESGDGLSGWEPGRYPGLERLRVSVVVDEAEAGGGGGE
jgi:transglutaminase-like putative cysteine protease